MENKERKNMLRLWMYFIIGVGVGTFLFILLEALF